MEFLGSYLQQYEPIISPMSIDESKMLKDTVINNLQNGMKPLIEALYAPHHVKAEMNDDLADDNSKKSAHKSIEYRKKGNDFYSKKDHSEIDHEIILHLYSKSAAYAPQGSEELALAYGNRSALWLHLRKYDLCLIDIERALQVTKCNNLKGKLLKRQEGCLNLRSDIPNKPKKLQFLAYNPSKLLPCAANSVALVHNEKYGWHYIANRNIKPGEIVISEDTSYASVENDQIYLVCSHCLAFAWAGIPCDSCVFAIYCSEHCKQEAWNKYHDTMCSKLPILHSIIAKLSADVFSVLYLSTRIVDTFIKKEGIEKVLEEAGKFDKEQDHNSGKFSADMGLNCKKFGTLYNLSNAKIDCDTETASVTSIFNKLNFIIDLNIFKFIAGPPECDDNSVCQCINLQSCIKNKCAARGRVIGPCSSFINHSCMPNVRQIFLPGPKIIVLSMRPINKGEQLFICYGPSAMNTLTESRQDELRREYFFNCDCPACEQNMPDFYPIEALHASKKVMENQLLKTFGKSASMLSEPVDTWHYSEKLYKAAVKMCEFLHNRFDAWESFYLSGDFRYYIQQCFLHLYNGDHVIRLPPIAC